MNLHVSLTALPGRFIESAILPRSPLPHDIFNDSVFVGLELSDVSMTTTNKMDLADLMEQLTEEQMSNGGLLDTAAKERCDRLRSLILARLRESYGEDDLMKDERGKSRVGSILSDADYVTLRSVGSNEKSKKEFGKRVFREQLPAEVYDLHRGRFSKKMLLPYSNETRREVAVKESSYTQAGESIFSPRNNLIRSGALDMSNRRPCVPLTRQAPSLIGVLPTPGVVPKPPQVQTARRVIEIQGFDRPPAFDSSGLQRPKGKLRECRTYNNYLMEVAPRKLPTIPQRLDRIYKT